MNENTNRFNKIINNIEFKMIRSDDKCWIKVVPLVRISKPTSIHLLLNDEYYNWDIYDENGIESHKIYFEGFNINPSFYLRTGKNSYRIDFKNKGIEVIPIKENHKKEIYLKKNCNYKSSKSSCWAKAVYYTSRPDKPPFNDM